jgi:hypothetical protein
METSNPTPCHHSKIFFEINEWIATWDFFQPFSGCNCSTNFLMIIIEQSLKLMCLESWWSCSFAQDIGALHRKRSLKYSWNSTSLLGAFSWQAQQNHHVYSVTAISLCGLKLLLKHRTKWVFQSTFSTGLHGHYLCKGIRRCLYDATMIVQLRCAQFAQLGRIEGRSFNSLGLWHCKEKCCSTLDIAKFEVFFGDHSLLSLLHGWLDGLSPSLKWWIKYVLHLKEDFWLLS